MSLPPSYSGGSMVTLNEFSPATCNSTFFGASGTDVESVAKVVLQPKELQLLAVATTGKLLAFDTIKSTLTGSAIFVPVPATEM